MTALDIAFLKAERDPLLEYAGALLDVGAELHEASLRDGAGNLIYSEPRSLYIEFEGEQKELEATVRFVVEPHEPRTRDTPARDAYAEILSVKVGELDIEPLLGKEIERVMAEDLMRGMGD